MIGAIDTIHWLTALISAISLILLYLPKWAPRFIPKWVPVPLIVIILMVIVSVSLDLESHGVSIVGNDIATGFPAPTVPDFSYFIQLIPGAVVLAIVSYMGSIALAKRFHQQTLEEHKKALESWNSLSTNQEIRSTDKCQNGHSTKSTVTPLLSIGNLITFQFVYSVSCPHIPRHFMSGFQTKIEVHCHHVSVTNPSVFVNTLNVCHDQRTYLLVFKSKIAANIHGVY